MTFKMTSAHLYWWPVEVSQPSTDPRKPGELEKRTLKILFQALEQAESVVLDAELAKLAPAERKVREHEHLERAVKDWSEVEDDDGNAVPFSLEMFRTAMQRTWFRIAVYKAYAASLAGDEARTKN